MLLLDTHVVIWLAQDSPRLSSAARKAIQKGRSEGGLAICSVTLLELAQMIARGRVTLQSTLDAFLAELERHVTVKHITARIAVASTQWADPYPRDPMDRVIGATALVEGLPLVTADERIRQSTQLKTIW